jgi:hypothetical protein
MRSVFSILSFVFVIIAACSIESPPSEATQPDDLAGAPLQARSCPTICGEGTLCRLPDGTCTEVCNACVCSVQGGAVVSTCSSAAAPAASTIDDSLVGGTCGNTICGKGTFCCNPSCSACVPIGDFCTQQVCNPAD